MSVDQGVTTMAIAAACLVFWGCGESRDCLKWRTAYGSRPVCTSYSDTGHCRAYRYEPTKYQVCDEWAPEPTAKTEQ